ncbi:M48 family metallopeptidase [Ekhidna sp.]
MFAIRTTLATFILLILGATYAQESTMVLHDENSTELISELRKQKRDEIKLQNYPTDSDHGSTYRQITNYLVDRVLNEHLINDPELNELLHTINKKLVEGNPSVRKVKKILVDRSGFQNAASYGEGTITINLGLIATAKSEEEIAFIMAHEIAHYHLNHLRNRIDNFINRQSSQQTIRRLRKIPSGSMSLEDLEFVQGWFRGLYQNSREKELEADALAMEMMKNSGFSNEGSLKMMQNLSSAYQPPYPLNKELFREFAFEQMPFKRRWLDSKRISAGGDLIGLIMKGDSIATHPDAELRLEKLEAFENPINTSMTPLSDSLKDRLNLEMIYSFYYYDFYDFGIHHALQLKKHSDSTSTLDFHISRMLYEIALAKNDRRLPIYVMRDLEPYPKETKVLNYFFYNLTVAEASEISYLYTKRNFDESNPNHYRVLYRIHEFTNRLEKNKELKKDFKLRFPKENIYKYPVKKKLSRY